MKLHGLRHTWATLALQEGIDIHVVSDRFDHSSTHITSEIYTHVTRPMQSDAADRVAARILSRGLGAPNPSDSPRSDGKEHSASTDCATCAGLDPCEPGGSAT
jgi:hypothetical protein